MRPSCLCDSQVFVPMVSPDFPMASFEIMSVYITCTTLKTSSLQFINLPLASLHCSDIRHVTSCCCGLLCLSVKKEKRGKLGKENEENNIIKLLLQVSFMSSIFVWYQCQVLENVFFILSTPLSTFLQLIFLALLSPAFKQQPSYCNP